MDPKQMLQDAGMTVNPADLPERFRAAADPPLPTVGRIVEYYNLNWIQSTGRHHPLKKGGPFAAVVSGVYVHTTGDGPIVAEVDLVVFSNNTHTPIQVLYDVPGVMVGVSHKHSQWWQWPTRS